MSVGILIVTHSGIGPALHAAGLRVLEETVSWRESSGGRYVSVKLSFHAEDRAQYEAAHVALRGHPEVKWTL